MLVTKSEGVHDFMNHGSSIITTDEDRLIAALHSKEAMPALGAVRLWKETEVIALSSRRNEPNTRMVGDMGEGVGYGASIGGRKGFVDDVRDR
jgi:hypothetical protein